MFQGIFALVGSVPDPAYMADFECISCLLSSCPSCKPFPVPIRVLTRLTRHTAQKVHVGSSTRATSSPLASQSPKRTQTVMRMTRSSSQSSRRLSTRYDTRRSKLLKGTPLSVSGSLILLQKPDHDAGTDRQIAYCSAPSSHRHVSWTFLVYRWEYHRFVSVYSSKYVQRLIQVDA